MLLSEFYGINSMPIALLHCFMGGDKMPGTQGENIFTHDVLAGYRCSNTPWFRNFDKRWFYGLAH